MTEFLVGLGILLGVVVVLFGGGFIICCAEYGARWAESLVIGVVFLAFGAFFIYAAYKTGDLVLNGSANPTEGNPSE